MPIVPMFHVFAWGLPYTSLMNGAKLVLPGRFLDGQSLHRLIHSEAVTIAAAVPTVWMDLLAYTESIDSDLATLNRAGIGGSNAPLSVIRTFEERYNVRVIHGWGMTELCAVASIDSLKRNMIDWPAESRYQILTLHGRPIYGVRMRLVDENGAERPNDGVTSGSLQVRGPWVAGGYFKGEGQSSFTSDGWFNTGDIATINGDSYMRLVDREKDVIKSGGEWISSIDVENATLSHPAVREAACVAVPHSKWGERPLLLVILKDGQSLPMEELHALFEARIPKWWIPDEVVIVDALPHSGTGKLLKRDIREAYRNHVWAPTRSGD